MTENTSNSENTESTEAKPKITAEELVDKLIPLYNNIWDLEFDIKDLISQAKEDEVEDVSLLNQIAKARAYNKISGLQEKAEKQLATIQKLGF